MLKLLFECVCVFFVFLLHFLINALANVSKFRPSRLGLPTCENKMLLSCLMNNEVF